MADCVRLTYPGRPRNCQAKTVTLAGWPIMVAAWTPEEHNARALAQSLVERTLDFWRSAALLSVRQEDLQAALRASVNYGMGEAHDAAQNEAMLAVAVFAKDAACWGRAGLITECFRQSGALGWMVCSASGVLIFGGARLMFIFLSPLPEDSPVLRPPDERTRYDLIMRRGLLISLVILLVMMSLFPSVMEVFISGIRSQYAMMFL